MRILHTADWHLDQSNLEYTLPAIEAAIESAGEYDLFVHAGDLAVHRGKIHPNVAWEIRRLMTMCVNRSTLQQGILVPGNHDVSYMGEVKGMAPGILAGGDQDFGINGRLAIANQPRSIDVDGILFLCVPSPSKYQIQVWRENNPLQADMDPDALLAEVVRGLITEADQLHYKTTLGIFHGTFRNAVLGNEQLMTSGMDISLPTTAFNGCQMVMAGHIHNKQIMDQGERCPIYYPGASAPLTWNDKRLEPAWYLYETETDDQGNFDYSVTTVPVPVLSQMIETDLELEDSIEIDDWKKVLSIIVDESGATAGDRVRINLSARGALIDTLSKKVEAEFQQQAGLKQLAVVKTRTDAVRTRFDVGTDWNMITAFTRWAEISGIQHEQIDPLLEIVHEVEDQVTDRHLDAQYECKPISISATNWCQYEKVLIDFADLSPLVAITGDNYAGKSNLAHLWEFSRYKKTKRDNLGELIRKGQEIMESRETFESRGQVYRIIRTLKRKGNSAEAKLVFVQRTESGEWTSVCQGTAAETQATIERLIGPYDLFTATTFAVSGSVASLCDLRPAEMKDVLLNVLQRDFASRSKIVSGWSNQVGHELEKFEAQLSVLDQDQDMVKDLESSISDERALNTVRADDIAQLDVKIGRAITERDRLVSTLSKMDADGITHDSLQVVVDAAQIKIGQTRTRLKESDDARSERDKLTSDIAGYPTDEDLEKARKDRDAQLFVADATSDKIDAIKQEYKDVLDPMCEQYNDVDKQLGVECANMESLRRASETNRSIIKKAEVVPCEGSVWERKIVTGITVGPEMEFIDMSACPLISHVSEARTEYEEQKTKMAEMVKLTTTVGETRHKLISSLEKLVDERKEKQETASADSLAAMAEFNLARELFEERLRLVVDRRQLEQRLAVGSEIIAVRDELTAQLKVQYAEHEQAMKAVADLGFDAGLRNESSTNLAALENALATNKQTLADIRFEHAESETTIARYTGQLTVAGEAAAKLKTVKSNAATARKRQRQLNTVLEALNRDGIPYLLLEQYAIPHLQQTANNYLRNTDITISIDSERELGDGTLRNEVRITFTDHRGPWSLSAASGMQATVIGMALRNALADLLASATGSKIWFCLQDEGFGTMKEKHLDGAKRTLRQIANERGWMLYASHIDGMEGVADNILQVTDDQGVSSVAII